MKQISISIISHSSYIHGARVAKICSRSPLSTGNIFQDSHWMPETMDEFDTQTL
jgi:hypothetical protein